MATNMASPSRSLLPFIGLALGLIVTLYFHWALPQPQPFDAPLSVFSEARAREHIRYLTEDIGHRTVGTYNNDVLAVQYLLSSLRSMEAKTHADSAYIAEISAQTVTGSMHIEFLLHDIISIYSNLTNVLLKLTPRDTLPSASSSSSNQQRKALLISSHFDSAIGSVGASDALSGIGTMLESARLLLQTPANELPRDSNVPLAPIIFNFNGGEESGLQAAHGFITRHKWAAEIGAFVNLEACGAGGKEILFQAGPGNAWLAEAYAKVPRPHGTVAGEDIFSRLQAVPSDTDYRIYRDFRHIPGLDMAFYKNGAVYHTNRDKLDQIDAGSLQHLGENLVPLMLEIASNKHMTSSGSDSDSDATSAAVVENKKALTSVYFDVLGRFMVVVPAATVSKLYILYTLIAIAIFFKERAALPSRIVLTKGLIYSFAAVPLTLVVASICSLSLGAFISYIAKMKMSWYSSHWNAALLYTPPSLAGLVLVWTSFISKYKQSVTQYYEVGLAKKNEQENQKHSSSASSASSSPASVRSDQLASFVFFWGFHFFFWFLSLLVHFAGYGSSYIFAGVSMSCLLIRFISSSSLTIQSIFSPLLSGLLTIYMSMHVLELFIPIMGRSGHFAPSELVVSGMVGGVAALCSLPIGPLLYKLSHSQGRKVAIALLSVSLLTFSVLFMSSFSHSTTESGTSVSFPYTFNRPKRLFVQQAFHLQTVDASSSSSSSSSSSGSLRFFTTKLDASQSYSPPLVAAWADALSSSIVEPYICGPLSSPDLLAQKPGFDSRDGDEFESIFPFSKFLGRSFLESSCLASSRSPSIPPLAESISVSLLKENVDDLQRRLTLTVNVGQEGCWSLVNITNPSTVSHMSHPPSISNIKNLVNDESNVKDGAITIGPFKAGRGNGDWMIRHVGSPHFGFDISIAAGEILNLRLSVTCLDPLKDHTPLMVETLSKLPDWVTPSSFTTYIADFAL